LRLRELLYDPFLWFWAPLSLALLCTLPIWLTRRPFLISVLRFLSLGLVVLSILATAFWSWFFKDGLGPGFIPSTGWIALQRFWEGFAIPLAIAATEALGISLLFGRRLKSLRASSTALQADD
jgi:hypothetical protein